MSTDIDIALPDVFQAEDCRENEPSPRSLDSGRFDSFADDTLTKRPRATIDWIKRLLAQGQELSASVRHRLLGFVGLQPHRAESVRLSACSLFVNKVRDSAELCLDPPHDEHGVVRPREEFQQTLDRAQPSAHGAGLGHFLNARSQPCPASHNSVVRRHNILSWPA